MKTKCRIEDININVSGEVVFTVTTGDNSGGIAKLLTENFKEHNYDFQINIYPMEK